MAELPPDRLYQQLLHVCRFLDRQRIPYMVIGGIAVGVWSAPRATVDLDFVIGASGDDLTAFVQSASDAGFVIFEPKPVEVPRTTFLRMHLKEPDARLLTIDFFPADDDYKRAALDRAAPVRLREQEVRIAAPDDVILLKLLAGRGQDLVDAENIVRTQRDVLDRNYLRKWAERLSLMDALSKLLNR
ncbi:MAG: hypothetical protein AB1515_04465 [Nitrospirota bacterium]